MNRVEFMAEIKEHPACSLFRDNRYLVDVACFGDYDNSGSVERANKKDFEELKNPLLSFSSGMFNSKQTYIDLDEISEMDWNQDTDKKADELVEILNGLMDYPAISDFTVSEIESELSNEAWNDAYESEFRDELEKKFGLNLLDLDYNRGNLRHLFEEKREQADIYWHCERGGNMYVDVKRVAQEIELSDLKEVFYMDFETDSFYLKKLSVNQIRDLIVYLEKCPVDIDTISGIIVQAESVLSKIESEKINQK